MDASTLFIKDLFPFFLILTRVSFALFLLPGFGEVYVTKRVRLFIAFGLSLFLVGPLSQKIGVPSEDLPTLFPFLFREALVGCFFGILSRIFLLSLELAGSIISYQSSLAMAMTFNPLMSSQGSIIGSLLSTIALVLFFELDIHHLVLKALQGTYTVFPVGGIFSFEDASNLVVQVVKESFKSAFFWAGPFLILNTIFFMGLGLLNRLMPQFAVFFIATPVQLFIGLTLLMTVLSIIMTSFFKDFEKVLHPFLGG